MKKLYLFTILLLAALPLFATHVEPETARRVATHFLNNNGKTTVQLADLSKEAGFPNLFIFNAEEGFVVMSADDCVKPILGYSLTGKFVVEDMPENISSWLQGYNDEIQNAIDNQTKASPSISKLWKDLTDGNPNVAKATSVVDPLIQTQWDQGSPYNSLCPSGTVTGCVATAMAQVMNYWNYPAHGIGSHSYTPNDNPSFGEQFADFNSTNYDWDNMTDTYSSSSTPAQKQAVATLMYHCGVSVNMEYGPASTGGSSASTADAAYSLIMYFDYAPDIQYLPRSLYSDSDWINMLKSELNQSRPIQYRGNGSGGGHSFVCDGYNSDDYFHFNWGWSGSCDAYYSIDNLNPGPGGIGSGSHGVYNNNQGAIFGIRPSVCAASSPTNLTFTQSERNITLSWTAASGAVSYNIYCNNNYIGNSTTTSFSFVSHYGNNSYYVRSVDSSGALSLSSNTVNITIDYPLPVINDMTATLSGSNVSLNWTAPEWCFPETESAVLTYGSGVPEGRSGYEAGVYNFYWGHRYLPSDLIGADGKNIFKVSFYTRESGTFQLLLYQGSTTEDLPATLVSNTTFVATEHGWFDIILDSPVTIDATQDLWVFIYDPEAKGYPIIYCEFPDHDKGCYYCYDPYDPTVALGSMSGFAFLIKTYLTDGAYTYNLYKDGVKIAENIPGTTYNATLNDNAVNQFSLKTNYYGGETDNSNKVGFAKGTTSISTLEISDNDKMTVTEGSKLTVTGTISNNNAANLVIENGGQLIHSSTGVKATVNKQIEAYTSDDNGWFFIASPVMEDITPSTANGLLTGNYDLYYYDEPTYYWMNYKYAAFNMSHQHSYLYANNTATTLTFDGTLIPSNNPVSISGLSRTAAELNGFNLVGNPFVCNAAIDQDCYVIEGHNVVLAPSTKTFAPGEGAFVKATSDTYTVTFTKATGSKNATTQCFDLVVSQGKSATDRARVRFGEGIGMEKYNLKDSQGSQLSLWQDGKDYAVAYLTDQAFIPVTFKTVQNGTFTLTLDGNTTECNYLHLIDNLTGADVDLLQTPSYTFEAKTSDYESRFKLVFDEDALPNPAADNLIPSEGFFQILDMNGRMVTQRDAEHSANIEGLTPGVYLLRTIDGNKSQTQKIIIK